MKRVDTLKRMLSEVPISEMITCIPRNESSTSNLDFSVKCRYPKILIPTNIPEDARKQLETLFYKNPKKAIEEIIRYRFIDREILGYYDGIAASILEDCSSYQKCISFEGDGYRIYFNDFATSLFENTILKLERKSKRDSYRFIKRKIENGDAQHFHLSISGATDVRSRKCMFLENKDPLCPDPENALYYYASLKKDGSLDAEELKNLLRLIKIFTDTYGEFGLVTQTEETCVGYNVGSLKVTGIDKVPETFQKVYSLRKKEN